MHPDTWLLIGMWERVVNLASRRVMQKAGLSLVRTFRQPWPFPIAPRRRRWVLPAAVAAALLLGGGIAGAVASDSTGSGTARPQPTASIRQARPANPVPILNRTGARVPSSTVYGEVDANGHRHATGYFRVLGQRDAEQVTVYTFDTKADMQRYLRQNPPSDRKIGIQATGFTRCRSWGCATRTSRWCTPSPPRR
jgi:hypothetical protein